MQSIANASDFERDVVDLLVFGLSLLLDVNSIDFIHHNHNVNEIADAPESHGLFRMVTWMARLH